MRVPHRDPGHEVDEGVVIGVVIIGVVIIGVVIIGGDSARGRSSPKTADRSRWALISSSGIGATNR